MCNMDISVSSNATFKVQYVSSYQGDSIWVINGCSLHDSVSIKYCEESCKMNEHCTVWLAVKRSKEKVKVQFT